MFETQRGHDILAFVFYVFKRFLSTDEFWYYKKKRGYFPRFYTFDNDVGI